MLQKDFIRDLKMCKTIWDHTSVALLKMLHWMMPFIWGFLNIWNIFQAKEHIYENLDSLLRRMALDDYTHLTLTWGWFIQQESLRLNGNVFTVNKVLVLLLICDCVKIQINLMAVCVCWYLLRYGDQMSPHV